MFNAIDDMEMQNSTYDVTPVEENSFLTLTPSDSTNVSLQYVADEVTASSLSVGVVESISKSISTEIETVDVKIETGVITSEYTPVTDNGSGGSRVSIDVASANRITGSRKRKFAATKLKLVRVGNVKKRDHLNKSESFLPTGKCSCNQCGLCLPTKRLLRYHVRKVHKLYNLFRCEICEETLKSKCSLMKHLSKHHHVVCVSDKDRNPSSSIARCKICGCSFRSKMFLQFHMESFICGKGIKTQNSFLCHMCKKSFKLLHELEKHLDTHSLIDCPVCYLKFGSFYLYKDHVGHHTKEEIENYRCSKNKSEKVNFTTTTTIPNKSVSKAFPCLSCDKNFTRKMELEKHVYTHTGVAAWKCPECGDAFLTSSKYKQHYNTLHERIDKPFFCSFCKKGFSNPEGMRAHERIHKGIKPFKCDVCDKHFSQRGNLKDHMLIHTNQRPWKCSKCERSFKIKGDLTKHLVVHSGVKNYACTYCEKRFSRQSYLTRHVRTHTGERPYICDICNKGFSRSENCQEHRRIHTGERPYVCHCGATFKDSGNFCNHKKIHDPNHPKRKRNKNKTTEAIDASTFTKSESSTAYSNPFIQVLPLNATLSSGCATDPACVMQLWNLPGMVNNSNAVMISDVGQNGNQQQMVTLAINDMRLVNLIQSSGIPVQGFQLTLPNQSISSGDSVQIVTTNVTTDITSNVDDCVTTNINRNLDTTGYSHVTRDMISGLGEASTVNTHDAVPSTANTHDAVPSTTNTHDAVPSTKKEINQCPSESIQEIDECEDFTVVREESMRSELLESQ